MTAGWRGWVLAGALALGACASSEEGQILPPDAQYARALALYEAQDWRDAVRAFQTFTFNYPQDPRVTDARWLTAEAYFAAEDWATAAQEYLGFQRDYPTDPRAAEALFRGARSYQRLSLRPELDQRDTQRAIGIYDRLLAEYPRSDFADTARESRARLRNKLAEKEYLNAEFYFDHEDWKASEIYATRLVREYPDSDWLPAAYALLARARCEQGLEADAARAYRALTELYPDSPAARVVGGQLTPRCRGEGLAPEAADE